MSSKNPTDVFSGFFIECAKLQAMTLREAQSSGFFTKLRDHLEFLLVQVQFLTQAIFALVVTYISFQSILWNSLF